MGAGRRWRALPWGLAAVVAAVLSLAAARPAAAYPQYQLSSGAARCTECHFAPGGGGLVTDYGRDAIGGDQTIFGGDGAFLHGAARPPSWLKIGGDFRGAYVAQEVQDPEGAQQAVFPMQAELDARIAVGDFSLYGTGGLRGQIRSNPQLVPEQNYQPVSTSQLVSREHYLMWKPGAIGPYVRVGRFFAPFGLRLAEHVLYLRRDLGFNQLEESYNVSIGRMGDTSEVHLTAFFPDVFRHMGGRTSGMAVYAEQRLLDDTALLGVQGKLELGDGDARVIAGLVGKAYVAGARTLFLAEADVVRLMTPAGDSPQLVGAAGGAVFPARGLMITLLGERRQTDLRVRDTATNAAALLVNLLPYAHFELQVMGRLQFPAGGDVASTLFAQLHYIL